MTAKCCRTVFIKCWNGDKRGTMERINRICRHPLWKESVAEIQRLEEDRIFCRHNPAHYLDVARIAYIENLEKNIGISKEVIYAAALLHDIGRHRQYLEGIPHEEASAVLADPILRDCGFTEMEQKEIISAISEHRTPETAGKDNLQGLIYRADKSSRSCLFCNASKECNWGIEKKNITLKV